MSGYVRIHRSLIGHPAFRNDAEAMAFAWMVVRAAWKPARVRYKERAISLSRGQLAMSQRDMAHDLDRDKAWVERLWKRLKSEAMIEVATEAGVAVITIRNYAEYQAGGAEREAADEAPDEAGARQGQGTEQEREEVKKEVQDASHPSPRGNPFPCPDWADKQVWADFLANRKAKRLKNTATAYGGFLADLARWQCAEWPPPRLLEYAAAKGWGGIYNPREDHRDGHRQPAAQQGLSKRESPALALYKRGLAREAEEEDFGQDGAADWRDWPAPPAIGSG